MAIARLPLLDEHALEIAADVDLVWPALVAAVDTAFSRRGAALYARAVGSAEDRASGPRPLAVGSTIPGFRVVAAIPESELVLEGRHRFSTYALSFHLDAMGPGRSQLRAESRADFPGAPGRLYRMLVVGTTGHSHAVRHLLSVVRGRAEQPSHL